MSAMFEDEFAQIIGHQNQLVVVKEFQLERRHVQEYFVGAHFERYLFVGLLELEPVQQRDTRLK